MNDFYNKIEDFLAGNLSPEESFAFKAKMESEPDFAREVEAHKEANETVEMYTKIRLKEKVKTLHHKAKVKPGVGQRRIYSIAASISILILAGALWFANANFSNQALVADHFQLPAFTQRDIDNDNLDELSKKVADAYAAKDYIQAISLLSSIPESPLYNEAQYHLGNLYLETNQPAKAIAPLETLIDRNDARYVENAQWLLVVAHLKNDDLEKTKLSLETILQNPNHFKYGQAKELKKKMSAFWRNFVF